MSYEAINFKEKFEKFDSYWTPKLITEMNDYQFKLMKMQGELVWHRHEDTDETYIVLKGNLTIMFRDGEVNLKEREMFVVPKGIEHNPISEEVCHVLLIEPAGVINTGADENMLMSPQDNWI